MAKSYKNLNFRLSEQKIERKRHVKYLGVILNEHLSLHEYMNAQSSKKLIEQMVN